MTGWTASPGTIALANLYRRRRTPWFAKARPNRHRRRKSRRPTRPKKARGGEIILRTRTQRIIFISGLAGAVLIVLIFNFLGWRAG